MLPPAHAPLADGARVGGWWHEDADDAERIVCDLCPRECRLRPGDRGFCFVRENREGEMVLTTYGRSTGFCIDPIEKKPLNQFYPGTSVLSFGTAGCNLGCKFCQNWSISKSREIEQLSENASPEAVAQAALQLGCKSVAYTYNDPVIWAEYAIDTARACREVGVKSVAVTAGYITPAARGAFYEYMDAANVDLKGFSEDFYKYLTLSHLEPVKETLRWLVHETNVWTEITNLIIPEENDSRDELKAMCDWILEALGPKVPVHFTAFHPDFRLRNREHTPAETLLAAYDIATRAGLNYPYVGNIQSPQQQTTYCPGCRHVLIERVGYTITRYELNDNRCRHCGSTVAGHYDPSPGNWGSRRQPVRISEFEVRAAREYGIAPGPRTPVSAAPVAPLPVAEPRVKTAPTLNLSSSAPSQAAQPVELQKLSPSREKINMSVGTMSPPPVVSAAIGKLSAEQEQAIVRSAIRVLAGATEGRMLELSPADLGELAHMAVLGAFVSAKRGGRLRGCCGFLGQIAPLAKALSHAAQRTATDDHRFPPIAPRELEHLDVEVWLLSNQQLVPVHGEARKGVVEIGKHGLQIACGDYRGLLLPGVATEHGFDAEQFLEQVCLKASLPPRAWLEKETTLWTFEGYSIKSAVSAALGQSHGQPSSLPFSPPELNALAQYCQGNLLAFLSGATPNYFAFGLPDGNVHGIALSLITADGQEFVQGNRLSVKDFLPLQSTLFAMTEGLAQSLLKARYTAEHARQTRLGLTILGTPSLHGSVADPDLKGLDPQRHMLMVIEQNRTAALFDPSQPLETLVAAAAREASVRAPEAAQIVAFECVTNMNRARIVNVPSPAPATGAVRQPAVAGRFYPADPAELSALVDKCLPKQNATPKPWPAIMVPHAGLIYSGPIAAQTLARVKFPSTVIIIGPKHTPYGVEWAVAPQATWQIPGATLASDQHLAQQLCQAIPSLTPDAAAHAQEHGIEVELPFIARLAPQTKVVGITIGGGDLACCREFAAGLSKVIAALPEKPLLVISSDMNHYASDAENRWLDSLALEAMETGDPEKLYNTVTSRRISMCGLLPAVIVMETLRNLNQLKTIERVAYGTSGDVSGDKSRVVGYAGVLLGG
jgi:AmmeMemoRadiSam system radical SAM enzyme/AmmeMemoRadiSam system protein B/AmmeMemoRadiSam system protein A